MQAPRAKQKRLELVCAIDRKVPDMVEGDPSRLKQILLNLLNNAIKFTEEGEVLIEAQAKERGEGQVSLEIRVADTGIGIPEDRIGTLFDSFTQVDASTTRRFGGTGLGLAICRRLVELMGGTIEASSTVGQGTCFTVILPYQVTEPSPEGAIPEVRATDLSVLVVDDNDSSRTCIVDLLRRWSWTADEAEGVSAALKRLQTTPYDVILLDLEMPGISGREMLEHLPEGSAPVLIMGMGLTPHEARQLRNLGASGFVPKPVSPSLLMDRILEARFGSVEAAAQAQEEVPFDASLYRVLLVEDNIVNQRVCQRILQRAGFSCDVAADGREAVELHESMPFDIILMDCQMPEMDGYSATELIREREGDGPRIPILAMTANALAGDRERCITAGMDDYLSKPIDAALLVSMIQQWLVGKPSRPVAGSKK